MISAWRWFKDHAWLLLIIVVLGGLWLLAKGRDKSTLLEQINMERKVVREKAQVRKLVVQNQTREAIKAVEEKFSIEFAHLESQNKEKVRELEVDPEALVEFIIRSSS